MSAISFRAAEPQEVVPRLGLSGIINRHGLAVDVALLVVGITVLALMEVNSGQETIPYHVLFLCLTVVYGFRVWAAWPTVVVTLLVTTTTGFIMYSHWAQGVIDAAELAEIPLMPALFVAMVWHARRRVSTLRQLELMADERRASLEREREFFRDASHAIRTPVTIARGHLELVQPGIKDVEAREDLDIALRQLDRMASLSNRLLALAQLDAGYPLRPKVLDLHDFLMELGRNWSARTDRCWKVEVPSPAEFRADPEWLGLAIDALVENAVHFTEPGGAIMLGGEATDTWCCLTVADSGPGINPDDLAHIFDRFWHRIPMSGQTGSGLGLAFALATAKAHGGTLTAANRPEGGAVFVMTLPLLKVP